MNEHGSPEPLDVSLREMPEGSVVATSQSRTFSTFEKTGSDEWHNAGNELPLTSAELAQFGPFEVLRVGGASS